MAKRLKIEQKFRKAFCLANGLPRVSPLELVIRIGVAAIKCSLPLSVEHLHRSCSEKSTRREECPVCVLAERFGDCFRMDGVRFANSILFCGLSGELLGENNPPMATKFGSIYGHNVRLRAQLQKRRWRRKRTKSRFIARGSKRTFA